MRFALIIISYIFCNLAFSQINDDSIIVRGFIIDEYHDKPICNATLRVVVNDTLKKISN